MNRADERALAWELVDGAKLSPSTGARVRLNMMIGAGELDSAILELLTLYAHTGTALSGELLVALEAWVFGYTGAPAEAELRHLLDQIPRDTDEGSRGSGSHRDNPTHVEARQPCRVASVRHAGSPRAIPSDNHHVEPTAGRRFLGFREAPPMQGEIR
ncbi:hypothetical protein [Mycobacterium sp. AT1]|uniref:hypothetical protein n=1 Tax=Mycobacterium sp. AT1 TaxID=1961706 RepID=UPI0009AC3127|nr:hypothetical protein [Mycobacterium sp. AT1]OPX12339.1 hypothetical protein B1790_04010 [Mycobacterium sp. AT1]